MSYQRSNEKHELEALEPRVLLSADAGAVAIELSGLDSLETFSDDGVIQETLLEEAREEQLEESGSGGDLFDSAEELGVVGGESSLGGADDSAEGGEVQPEGVAHLSTDPSASILGVESGAVAGVSTGAGSMVSELVETLRAANGPPWHWHLTPELSVDLQGGVLDLGEDGVLSGSGSISGGIAGGALIRPGNSPGHITISSFSPGRATVTQIEIEGLSQGTTYDWIEVTGAAELAGTLQIIFNPQGGYVPSLGDTFSVITWGSYSGDFDNWLGTASIAGHPTWALKPQVTPAGLNLVIVDTPTIAGPVGAALDSGLDSLASVTSLLDGVGAFAATLPLIGNHLGGLSGLGSAIQAAVADRLSAFPSPAEVVAAIEGWDGTTFGGFALSVRGVLAQYGTLSADPMSWTVSLELTPSVLTQVLSDILGGVFGAALTGGQSVNVGGSVLVDFSFGYDSGAGGFVVGVESLEARVDLALAAISGVGFSFSTPAGVQSLSGNGATINLTASVVATPDAGILTDGQITLATLGSLTSANVGDAFNLANTGTLEAVFPLAGNLSFAGFALTGNYAVHIRTDDLFHVGPELWLEVSSGALSVMDQVLNGGFSLRNTGTATTIEVTGVSFELGAGGQRLFSVQNGSGTFLLLGGELAGVMTMDLALGPASANLSLALTGLELRFNTSEGSVPAINGNVVDLPAGPYYRVSGAGLLGVGTPALGLSGDFLFELLDNNGNPADGYEEVAIAVANGVFSLSDGVTGLVNVNQGTGVLVYTGAGLVGSWDAEVSLLVSDLDLEGAFTVTLNDTGNPYSRTFDVNGTEVTLDVVAGPYLKVTAAGAALGEHARLSVLGTMLTGDFVFERATTLDGDTLVTVAASAVSLDLGTGTSDLLSVSNGSGLFLLSAAGLAGSASVDMALDVSGLGLSGTFSLTFNNTAIAVSETVTAGGSPVTLNAGAGPFLEVEGEGVTFTVLGVSMTGDFGFQQRTTVGGEQVVTVTANNVAFDLGTSLLSATGGEAFFIIMDSGMAGEGEITVHVDAFGASFSHTFSWAFNTTGSEKDHEVDQGGERRRVRVDAGPFNRIDTGSLVDISIETGGVDYTLNGRFILTLHKGDTDYVTVAASGVSTTLSAGPVGLSVSDGAGGMVIFDAGIAGEVRVGSANLAGVPGISVEAQNLALRFNTTGAEVGNPDAVLIPISDDAADDISLQFVGSYYADYFSVEGSARVIIAGAVTLGGDFVFERARLDTNSDSLLEDVLKLGVTGLHFDLEAGGTSVVSFHNGNGAFILMTNGLAGEAELEFQVGIIGLSGSIALELNTTGAAVVSASVPTPEGTRLLDLAAGNYVRVLVDGHLHLGAMALPFTVVVEVSGGNVEFRRASDDELLVSVDSTGTITLGPTLESLADFDFAKASPFDWVMMLRELGLWFESFQGSELFEVEIPFTGGTTLGDALDWSQLFLDTIYKYMVSVEVQSTTMTEGGDVHTGALAGETLTIQLGDEAPVVLTLNDVTGDALSRDAAELVDIFAAAISGAGLFGRVESRLNKDGRVVIALLEEEIAAGLSLGIAAGSSTLQSLGFGTGDSDTSTIDQLGVLTERYGTEDFVEVLADILNDGLLDGDGGVTYQAAQQVYSYSVSQSLVYDTMDLFGRSSLPFDFDWELGPIAGAELTGALEFSAEVGFTFTLGFDLGAAEVPRILSSTSVPVPANGRISEDAKFGIYLNDEQPVLAGTFDSLYPLTLLAGSTADNNSIEDLATDLNALLAGTAYGDGSLGDILIAQKAGNGLAISVRDSQLGVINRITLVSPKNGEFNTFGSEMGFGMDVVDLDGLELTTADQLYVSVANAPIKGLFIEDVAMSGSVAVNTTADGIDGSLRFGFVEITTEDGAFGTLAYDGVTPAPFAVSLGLEDQTTGETRFYFRDLMNGTSSDNLANMVPAFEYQGSLLARLDNIKAAGLGFSMPLGSNPEVSVWIPDLHVVDYNPGVYDEVTNNTGTFVTYPDLSALQNFTSLSFTQIIRALNAIADQLSELSAFSFLDSKLPVIDISVNDMVDYAAKFAELVDGAADGGAESMQEAIAELESQIELLFDLDPSALSISLDDWGLYGLSGLVSGGVDGVAHATLELNPFGSNNAIKISTNAGSLGIAGTLNGATLRIVADPSLTGTSATATWDPDALVLTVYVNSGHSTANAILAAINGLGGPWSASLGSLDAGNTGLGVAAISAPVTTGGINGSVASKAWVMPGGDNNNFTITSSDLAFSGGLNGSSIRLVGSREIDGNAARISWDDNAKLLLIEINPGVTSGQVVVDAINAASTPWNAALAPPDNDGLTNSGAGPITTSALKFSFNFTAAYADSLPFQLDLQSLVSQLAGDNAAVRAFLEFATTLVQVGGSGYLSVSASAELQLDFGLDLTTPGSVRPFFYDTTGITLLAKVLGTDIEIEASLGSVLGIWIRGGQITLDKDGDPETDAGDGDRGAEFRLGLKDNNGDGRHYLDEAWFDGDSIDLRMDGGVSATLPVYAPLETIPLSGDSDDNGDGYPDNYLVVEIPDLVRMFINEAVSTEAQGLARVVPFGGRNNNLEIISTNPAHNNFDIIFLDTLSGGGASAIYDSAGNTLTVNIDAGVTTAAAAVTAIQAAVGGGGSFATTGLTLDDSGAPNDGSGALEKLALIAPDFGTLFDGLELCDVLASSSGVLLDGLDALLGKIQDGLNAIVYNTNLPLIGNGLQGAANFIDDFRSGLLLSLRQEVDAAGGNGLTALENAIKKAFWNTLGPDGLDLLVDFETGEALDISAGYSQLDVVLDCETGLVVNVRLSKTLDLLDTSENPIDFDIGIPGFGLEVDGNVSLSIGFDFKLGFGVSLEEGFFFNSSLPTEDPELVIEFLAEIPGLHAGGELLFLQLDVMDDPDDPSFFRGFFEVDLRDPDNNGRLTFAELTSSGTRFGDLIDANLGAEADINLDLAASFGGQATFPRVLAEFHLDWLADLDSGLQAPQVSFTNVQLDLGSFIADFLGPILEEIQKITEPVQPIIDIITARLPVISDLAGRDLTLLDLAEMFGLLEPSTVRFIESVIQVVELINDLEGLGEGEILIPFGSFALGEDEDGNRTSIQPLAEVVNRTMDEIAAAAAAATGPGASSSYASKTSGFVSDVGSLDNFKIPFFENPAELFNLFIGEPVSLVEWRMPKFKFEFTYTQKIPIYPPLYAQFGGTVGAEFEIGFGYDTYGIQRFVESEDKNFLDILDGFYVLDYDSAGNERPEIRLYGELFAGASINLLVAEAGVKGGLGFEVTFDLNDVEEDGKVRVSEIVANAQIDPRCIFDIEGRVYLFLEAFLSVDLWFLSIEKTWRFAEITLFSFDITCPEPVLGSNSSGGEFTGGELYLNFGSRAADREEIDTTDKAEIVLVRSVGGVAGNETIEVQWESWKQTFEGVTKVILEDAGIGDDYLDFRGVKSEVEVHGGEGNDTIFLGDGAASTAYGDAGNDTITAGVDSGATGVVLAGGSGNDILTAGSAAITIYGDGGNDTITGSGFDDLLYGDDGSGTVSDGADIIDAGAGNDEVYGGLGNDVIEAGEGDDWVYGGGGNDTIRGSRGDDILDGGQGDDRMYGSSGNDVLVGGAGSDWANGHGGIDLLIGEGESDLRIGGVAFEVANAAAIRAAVTDIPRSGISIASISGGSSTYTDSNGNVRDNAGNDILIGGGNTDVLFGGPGNDFLYGGNFLNLGETGLIEEDHNDFFDGGTGNDTIFGDDAMGRTGTRDTGIAINSAIFYDLNWNGVKDDSETGFGGVTVELYRNDDVLIGTTETEVDGSFRFMGLDADRYYLVFSLPTGLSFTTPLAGGDAEVEDSDKDSDVYDGTVWVVPAGKVLGQSKDFELTFDETESSIAAGYTGLPRVSASDVYVVEGNTGVAYANIVVTLSGPQLIPVTLDYVTANGDSGGVMDATEESGDYGFVSGTLLFGPGETSKTISVPVFSDGIYEEHQQFRLLLSNPSAGIQLPASPETEVLVTILNDDPIPQISISDYLPESQLDENGMPYYTVGEGDDARFIISLSNPSMYDIDVWYLVDAAYDCGCDPNPATPSPLFADGDYIQPVPTMVTIPAGTTQIAIEVQLVDDLLDPIDEYDEVFYVDLYNPTYARLADSRGMGVIPDDDPEVSVSIHEAGNPGSFELWIPEGDIGFTYAWLEVSLSKVSDKVVTVRYSSAPGSAVESVYSGGEDNKDYEGLPYGYVDIDDQDLVFSPGETSKLLLVKVYGDEIKEDDEFFFVNLIGAENAVIARNSLVENNHVTIWIQNDDALLLGDAGPWSVFFGNVEYGVQEPDSGLTFALIDIHRTPGSSNAVAVFYTQGGTATAGADYGELFREVVYFEGNSTVKSLLIPIYADGVTEGDETVLLSLRNPTGGPVRGSPDDAVLTIRDADLPQASVDSPFVTEGDSPASTLVSFKVSLDAPAPVGGVLVDWQTVSLTARSELGMDFIGNSGQVFIPAGGLSATLQVTVTHDAVPELTERFAVRLTGAVRASIAEDGEFGICTIYDNDLQTIEGRVFFDTNGNGFMDLNEKGIEGVDVTLGYMVGAVQVDVTVQTNADGFYQQAGVPLGAVTVSVDGKSVQSPWQRGGLLGLLWSGEYSTTTDNEVQTVEFDGTVGISPFAPVGYKNSISFSLPEEADDVGRGGTDDTIFGGPGDDTIDAGAGDDHVVGGHWQTATDGNMPVNKAGYDAVVVVVTSETDLAVVYGLPGGTTLHSIYDDGPVFSVIPEEFAGTISGQIWVDANANSSQGVLEPLFTGGVLVTLLDCDGNPVNAVFSTTGTYTFSNLYVDPSNPTAESHYVVEFSIPEDYEFVNPNVGDGNPDEDLSGQDNDAEFVNRTRVITLSAGAPTESFIDAGISKSGVLPGASGFEFSRGTYSVFENGVGYVEVVVRRSNSFVAEVVLLRSADGVGPNGATSSPEITRNYGATLQPLVFEVGETDKIVSIPVYNREMAFCEFRYFSIELRDATGRPYDEAGVYIIGQGGSSITDDDLIFAGSDWDIVLGDSGNIPGYAVIAAYGDIGAPEKLGNLVSYGGPGNDVIYGDGGNDYIDGQLGDDVLAGGDSADIVLGGLGDDMITVGQGDDDIRGDHGEDTVFSNREVDGVVLSPFISAATPGILEHQRLVGGVFETLNEHRMHDAIEEVRLFGDDGANQFDLRAWDGRAFISGEGGEDTLLVEAAADLVLRDASFLETVLAGVLYGFAKDASISLATGATYHLASLENVILTDDAGDRVLDASGYSRSVTFEVTAGNDTYLGGTGDDLFVLDGDLALGTNGISGGDGVDLLDFSNTSAAFQVRLDLAVTGIQEVVTGNVFVELLDLIENASGGDGDDELRGNELDNVLTGGPGDDLLEGRAGDETYVFDADLLWGRETIVEDLFEAGHDAIDFSGTTGFSVELNLSVLDAYQVVNDNLQLRIIGEGVEEIIGGSLNDILRGNSNLNILRGGDGNDVLDGKSGDDLLDGGAGDDELLGGEGGEVEGDRVSESADTDFVLDGNLLVRASGETDVLVDVESLELTGGDGNNRFELSGWDGVIVVEGGGGFDTVVWGADTDFVVSDLLPGGGIQVVLASGGLGEFTGVEAVVLSGGQSDNVLDASGVTLVGGSLPRAYLTLIGGDGNDILRGSAAADRLLGGEGNDLMSGNEGDDEIDGGAGVDTLEEVRDAYLFAPASGRLLIDLTAASGDEEYDVLLGVESIDLAGGASNNRFDLSGWVQGTVSIDGAGGDDSIWLVLEAEDEVAGIGASLVVEDAGIASTGLGGVMTFVSIEGVIALGSAYGDVMDASGFSGSTWLRGAAGDDVFYPGSGATQILEGGEGDDVFVFVEDSQLQTVFLSGGDGEDTLDFSQFASGISVDLGLVGVVQTVVAGEMELYLSAEDVERVLGGAGDDTIIGNSLNNRLGGGHGNDVIKGGGGTNTLVEVADTDFALTDVALTSGLGFVDVLADLQQAELTGGASGNVLDASGFSGGVLLRGEGGDDQLVGGAAEDILIGGPGDDVLRGGQGDDVYRFDVDEVLGADTVDELPGGANGIDHLDFSETTTVGISVDLSLTTAQVVRPGNLTLTLTDGSSVEMVTGGDGDDVLVGNGLSNTFVGGSGSDGFFGNGGLADTVYEERDADFLVEDTELTITGFGAGLGTTEVDSLSGIHRVWLRGGDGNNVMDATAFSGRVQLEGLAGNDSLYGGAHDDVLVGGSGVDFLRGNGGDDLLEGGDGNDIYEFDQSFDQGMDTVVEVFGGGFADLLVGVGPAGVAVDLGLTTPQWISDFLTLTFTNAFQVEFSF